MTGENIVAQLVPVELHGFKLKPWSWGQTMKASPALLKILEEADRVGLLLEDLDVQEADFSMALKIGRLVFAQINAITDVLAISTGASRQQLEELSPNQVFGLAQAVLFMNAGLVKNSEAPAGTAVGQEN